MRDVSLGKEKVNGVNTCSSSHLDCCERNSQITDFSLQNFDEEENLSSATRVKITSLHGYAAVERLNTLGFGTFNGLPQRGSSCLNSYQEATNDCIKSQPEETRTTRNEGRMVCDCEDDGRTGDDELYKRSLESDIDSAPSCVLSVKEKIQMHVSLPPNFARTPLVRKIIKTNSDHARNLIERFSSETKKGKTGTKRKGKPQQKKSRIIIIPPNHPYKNLWNVFTILLTFISAYTTHMSIRDRRYEFTTFAIFTEAWFILDILLNFITAHQHSDGTIICNGSAVWARYLTTWFPIDALALVPWEGMYLTPIILQQNKRNIITKLFFRSKATVKVTVRISFFHLKCYYF